MVMLKTSKLSIGGSCTGGSVMEEISDALGGTRGSADGVAASELAVGQKVSKIGDTMTGALRTRFTFGSTSSDLFNSLYSWRGTTSALTDGFVALKAPNVGGSCQLHIKIELYSHRDTLTSTVEIGGYYQPGNASPWVYMRVFSSNVGFISSVQFALRDGVPCILFISANGKYHHPRVSITSASISGTIANAFLEGWEASLESDSSLYTIISTPPMNAGLMPDEKYRPVARGYLNGDTGAFSLVHGDLALTKTGTGVYSVTSQTLQDFSLDFAVHGDAPAVAQQQGTAGSHKLLGFSFDGAPKDVSGLLLAYSKA